MLVCPRLRAQSSPSLNTSIFLDHCVILSPLPSTPQLLPPQWASDIAFSYPSVPLNLATPPVATYGHHLALLLSKEYALPSLPPGAPALQQFSPSPWPSASQVIPNIHCTATSHLPFRAEFPIVAVLTKLPLSSLPCPPQAPAQGSLPSPLQPASLPHLPSLAPLSWPCLAEVLWRFAWPPWRGRSRARCWTSSQSFWNTIYVLMAQIHPSTQTSDVNYR